MTKKVTRIIWGLIALVAIIVCMAPSSMAESNNEKTAEQRILEILLEKNVIDKKQYEDLAAQLEREKMQKGHSAHVGFKKGFYIESTDGQSKIRFDGRLHADLKAYLGDHPGHSTFFIRRARLCASGTLLRYYDFRVEPEFGKGGSRLNDGFMNIHFWPYAQFKFGQFKVPFSMEEQHSDNWIDFVERSLANKLAPSRDIGAMVHGALLREKVYYQLGVFNGYKLNKVSDPDSGKDVAARVVVSPFKESGMTVLRGIHLGGAFTHGKVNLTKSQWWNSGAFKTAAGTTYLALSDGVTEKGIRTRQGLELNWILGSVALQSEYIAGKFEGLRLGTQRNGFRIRGGYLYLSWFPTGEKFVFKKGKPGRITPLRPFVPSSGKGGWGAFQVGARVEFLKADKGLLTHGYVDPARYTDEAKGYTLGLNWYPNDMVRFMLNYSHVTFDDSVMVDDTSINDEDVILTRFEVVF